MGRGYSFVEFYMVFNFNSSVHELVVNFASVCKCSFYRGTATVNIKKH